MKIIGSMAAVDRDRGAVLVEDTYDTDIEDLWRACTRPDRLARWIAQVSGDLRPGGTVQAVFTSTWAGPAVIESCDPSHHLLLTTEPGTAETTQIEAWLTALGPRTRLVVEERGLPLDQLPFYGAGWQVHLDDLGRSLAATGPVHPDGWSAETPAPDWQRRWTELTPRYAALRDDTLRAAVPPA